MEWTQNPTSSTYVLVRNDTQDSVGRDEVSVDREAEGPSDANLNTGRRFPRDAKHSCGQANDVTADGSGRD